MNDEMIEIGEILNVLFVDVDGVLVSKRCYVADGGPEPGFDPVACGIVRQIARRTNARIVFNSVWSRDRDKLNEQAALAGLGYRCPQGPIACTTYPHGTRDRLQAITRWIDENAPGDVRWAALDDAAINDERAIRIDPEIGVDRAAYREATRLLGQPDDPVIMI